MDPIEALAHADQQFSHVNDTLDQTIENARELLGAHDATRAWAILAVRISKALDCGEQRQAYAAEMLAAAAIRLARQTT